MSYDIGRIFKMTRVNKDPIEKRKAVLKSSDLSNWYLIQGSCFAFLIPAVDLIEVNNEFDQQKHADN